MKTGRPVLFYCFVVAAFVFSGHSYSIPHPVLFSVWGMVVERDGESPR